MPDKITAALAMLDVLESWGVDHLYGIPGGSFNSVIDALYQKRDSLRFIQVRHEEAGALAASAEAKLSGKIGVCSGTAGPGVSHLFNGLYDARMDHAPLLALVGQVASTAMNYDSFQELNENPMFADVSVYNRTVMTPESLPHVVDEAIRRAYAYNGVAVVTIPVDFGFKEISGRAVSSADNRKVPLLLPPLAEIKEALELIAGAKRPVLYFGRGAEGAGQELVAMSEQFALPLVMSVPAKGIVADAMEALLGSAARAASKPANEALALADLILFIGSDFPFAGEFFPKDCRFIQVDVDPAKMGRRHKTDVAILGDAREAMRQMLLLGTRREPDEFYKACKENLRNWKEWLKSFESRPDVPLRVEPVFREINRIAAENAVFVTDVGNTTIHAVRLLDMNGNGQKFSTSGWFATMGYGLPGGIAAKIAHPERQVFTLSGDGAFAMVMQEIITQVKYKLPVINIVFSNGAFGYIEAEQEDTNKAMYGVALQDADFAAAAEAMGAAGFKVARPEELRGVFDAAQKSTRPVVIDVKVENKRPLPVEELRLDPGKFSGEEISKFREKYEIEDMKSLSELLK